MDAKTASNDRDPSPSIELISVQTTAERLGVAPLTVRRWIASGRLPCYKLGEGGAHSPVRLDWAEVLRVFRREMER